VQTGWYDVFRVRPYQQSAAGKCGGIQHPTKGCMWLTALTVVYFPRASPISRVVLLFGCLMTLRCCWCFYGRAAVPVNELQPCLGLAGCVMKEGWLRRFQDFPFNSCSPDFNIPLVFIAVTQQASMFRKAFHESPFNFQAVVTYVPRI
jgi:hypothetical protein